MEQFENGILASSIDCRLHPEDTILMSAVFDALDHIERYMRQTGDRLHNLGWEQVERFVGRFIWVLGRSAW